MEDLRPNTKEAGMDISEKTARMHVKRVQDELRVRQADLAHILHAKHAKDPTPKHGPSELG